MDFSSLCSCEKVTPRVSAQKKSTSTASPTSRSAETLCGVGISFRCDDEKMIMMVDSLVHGGPAGLSGVIQKDDVLVEVAGVDVRRAPVAELGKLILGPPRSSVKMIFERYGKDSTGRVVSGKRICAVLQRAHISQMNAP